MHILIFAAHPDDAEFGCGGLIIKEVEKGNSVKIVVCSLGEAGSNGTPQGRKKEAQNAAHLAGAEIEFLNLGGDCHIEDSPKNAIVLAGIIRKYKASIVLAPELQRNQHPDHYIVAKLAHSACRVARYGGLKELKNLPAHKVNSLYFYPSRAEWTSRPDILVDVSSHKDKWEQTMSAHKSQMKTRSYHDLIFTKAQAMGASIGVKYAIGLWTNDPIRLNTLSDINLSSRNY